MSVAKTCLLFDKKKKLILGIFEIKGYKSQNAVHAIFNHNKEVNSLLYVCTIYVLPKGRFSNNTYCNKSVPLPAVFDHVGFIWQMSYSDRNYIIPQVKRYKTEKINRETVSVILIDVLFEHTCVQ